MRSHIMSLSTLKSYISSKTTKEETSTIDVILSIPNATIYKQADINSKRELIGEGELRVYSTVLHNGTSATKINSSAPQATFMTLENNDTPTKAPKSLITHPLMPRSSAEKIEQRTWRFTVAGSGFLDLELPTAFHEYARELEDILTDRIVYTNQYDLRNKLALVDDLGQVYGVLDEDVVVQDDDAVSLSENQKSPVVVHAIEPEEDEDEDKPLKLKVTVPNTDDMADYITIVSQSFGYRMVRGASKIAYGITASSTYINSRIPETQKPLVISPIIKNRISKVTKVSRTTLSLTNRVKTAVISRAFNTGYRVLKYWTAKDDPEEYSTMQNLCYSILNSAGILIQATEESIGIIATPTISATQEFASKTLGPDAKEVVSEALEGFRNFYLVYFDNAGVSRRAFLHTSRLAALQTAQEVKEGKIKMKERQKNKEHIEVPIPFAATAGAAAASASASASAAAASAEAAAGYVKKLYFKYVGKTDDITPKSTGPSSPSSTDDDKKTK
ncbi:hypothetical protein BGZ76_006787 [Entomortierella beljakovae]|nr:hypothetical protein BGZ76_006787 [Entomortierella beljakovae]